MIRMVGSGSYGKVYEAERNGKKYAVKEVFKEFLI
jgi:serine/threonine protein kinase